MKWGLICNSKTTRSFSFAQDVYEFLNEHGEIFPEESFAKEAEVKGYSLEEIDKKSDIVVTIGGDGTILRAFKGIEKPVFAIN